MSKEIPIYTCPKCESINIRIVSNGIFQGISCQNCYHSHHVFRNLDKAISMWNMDIEFKNKINSINKLDCPFCGGRGEPDDRSYADSDTYDMFIKCSECGASADWARSENEYESIYKAWIIWNTRKI